MKQKIEVQVTAAVDEQWPKVFADAHNAFAQGSNWVVVVVRNVPNMVLYDSVHDDGHASKPKPQFMDAQTVAIGFKDFDSMAAWWTNPQPVEAKPEKMRFADLPNGSYFQFKGETVVNVKTGELNGNQLAFQRAGQHLGYAGTALPSLQVVPFYGQITINVERE